VFGRFEGTFRPQKPPFCEGKLCKTGQPSNHSNGAIHAPSAAYRNRFSGKYEYRLITGGVGHNLPQEAPQAFAQAVVDVAAFVG